MNRVDKIGNPLPVCLFVSIQLSKLPYYADVWKKCDVLTNLFFANRLVHKGIQLYNAPRFQQEVYPDVIR